MSNLSTRDDVGPAERAALRESGSKGTERDRPVLKRLASNFAMLSAAEVVCRAASVLVTIALMKRLRPDGFGRIEFAFNIVFWLVLIVRDCLETIAMREIARHPKLTSKLVNHVLAVKSLIAGTIYALLVGASYAAFREPVERQVLMLYGLLLFSTALGLDFVFRGTERVGIVALSLLLRTSLYCAGVWGLVTGPEALLWVPACLAGGEFAGIGLVWLAYSRNYGLPRPVLGSKFIAVFLRRGKSIGLIHLCQAVIISADILVIALWSSWAEVGQYGASHRLVAAVMAFGLIFQQVVFPGLSRAWKSSPGECRRLMDGAVRALLAGFLPVAVGGAILARPMVGFLLPGDYPQSAFLLAVGIWRAPVLSLAFLYQSGLVAMNRESLGLKLLAWGSLLSVPLIAVLGNFWGLPGASFAVFLIGCGLAGAGYLGLKAGGCEPSAGHYLLRPVISSAIMVPVTLLAARVHVVLAIPVGAIVYLYALSLLGGLPVDFRSSMVGGRPHFHEGRSKAVHGGVGVAAGVGRVNEA